jgi:hypothetical protein
MSKTVNRMQKVSALDLEFTQGYETTFVTGFGLCRSSQSSSG